MALSNRAVPIYYGAFRDAVLRGEIPVNKDSKFQSWKGFHGKIQPTRFIDNKPKHREVKLLAQGHIPN